MTALIGVHNAGKNDTYMDNLDSQLWPGGNHKMSYERVYFTDCFGGAGLGFPTASYGDAALAAGRRLALSWRTADGNDGNSHQYAWTVGSGTYTKGVTNGDMDPQIDAIADALCVWANRGGLADVCMDHEPFLWGNENPKQQDNHNNPSGGGHPAVLWLPKGPGSAFVNAAHYFYARIRSRVATKATATQTNFNANIRFTVVFTEGQFRRGYADEYFTNSTRTLRTDLDFISYDFYCTTAGGGFENAYGGYTWAQIMAGQAYNDVPRTWTQNTARLNYAVWETGAQETVNKSTHTAAEVKAAQGDWITGAKNTIISQAATDDYDCIGYLYFRSHTDDWWWDPGDAGGQAFAAMGANSFFGGSSSATPPTISGVNPSSGAAASTTVISGSNLSTVDWVKFGTTNATSFSYDAGTTKITATVPAGSEGSTTLSVHNPDGTDSFAFTVLDLSPTVDEGFTPTHGPPGQQVAITGQNFNGTTSVKIGGVNVASFQVNSNTSITAVVKTSQPSGVVRVVNGYGADSTVATFTVDAIPVDVPVIGTIPASAQRGDSITITGSSFLDATITSIVINTATVTTFSVTSDTSITLTVPTGASTGYIFVTNSAGTGQSSTQLVIVNRTITYRTSSYTYRDIQLTYRGTAVQPAQSIDAGFISNFNVYAPSISFDVSEQMGFIGPVGSVYGFEVVNGGATVNPGFISNFHVYEPTRIDYATPTTGFISNYHVYAIVSATIPAAQSVTVGWIPSVTIVYAPILTENLTLPELGFISNFHVYGPQKLRRTAPVIRDFADIGAAFGVLGKKKEDSEQGRKDWPGRGKGGP